MSEGEARGKPGFYLEIFKETKVSFKILKRFV